jgi:gamma-glutamyltranspeptidase/glutathione hydrolase
MGGKFAGAADVMAEQSTGRGARGVVGAAAPVAAAIGAEILRAGGNAFDAVVAAGLAETVLLPPKCGLAGDLVALWYGPGAGQPQALTAVGGAPAALADSIRDGLPATGPLSVGVPAAPAGYAALAERGTFSLRRLVEPALDLAERGFVWAPICTTLAEESVELVARNTRLPTRYFPDGRAIAPGTVVKLPGLSYVLEEFSDRGAAIFGGPVGEAIVDAVQRDGGVLSAEDFAFGTAEWSAADAITVDGTRVWATPAPTHGAILLAALQGHIAGHRAPQVWERFHEARSRQRATLGDPAPTGTSMVSAVDEDGNAIVLIHSNSFPRFGSGIVLPDLDLILNNRAGRGFVAEVGHPGFPAPGRRPPTTLHAWAAGPSDATGPRVLGATPGGINQVPWNLQMLESVLSGCTRPGVLVTEPRWEWLNDPMGVRIEDGLLLDEVDGLRQVTDHVEQVAAWGLRSAQQVVAVPAAGEAREGAVDPRTGGAVVAV